MTTAGAKPLQPAKAERRARLTRLFGEVLEPLLAAGESYADISVERLITAVDISRSTFYVYFGDKGELLRAIGEDVTLDLAAAGAHWFEFDGGDREGLRTALVPLFDTYRRHQMVLRAITETAAYDPTIRALHLALVERAVTGLAGHIRALHGTGTITGGLDADLTASWLVWMLERGLYQLVAPASAERVERLLETLSVMVWRTLYATA